MRNTHCQAVAVANPLQRKQRKRRRSKNSKYALCNILYTIGSKSSKYALCNVLYTIGSKSSKYALCNEWPESVCLVDYVSQWIIHILFTFSIIQVFQ